MGILRALSAIIVCCMCYECYNWVLWELGVLQLGIVCARNAMNWYFEY
jgi:hypothetical protein